MTMNDRNQQDILSLSFSQKEKLSRNRKKSGFNVYQSWFYSDWQTSTLEQRQNLLFQYRIHDPSQYNDDDSVISDPVIESTHILQACAKHWSSLTGEIKEAWKLRTLQVNSLPVLGAYTSTPSMITDTDIQKSLTIEHDRISAILRNSLKCYQTFMKSKVRQFGRERVVSTNTGQVFRSFNCSHLFLISIFGSNFSKFHQYEVTHRTKATTIVYLNGLDRIQELFEVNGLQMLQHDEDDSGLKVVAGPKVIVRVDGREGIGIVRSENRNNCLNILLEDGRVYDDVKRPLFDNEVMEWDYSQDNDDNNQLVITEYHPLRLKIQHNNGMLSILFNRFKLSLDNNNILL
jgi:hypothetical protein